MNGKKTIFTPKDFEGAGQYIVKESLNKETTPYIIDTGYLSTRMQKIGWSNKFRENSGFSRYFLIDMSDGLCYEGYYTNTQEQDHRKWIWNDFSANTGEEVKQKICDYLNNNPYNETYRFATNEELVRVANYQKSRTK